MDAIEFSRQLRRDMTLPERRLWGLLRQGVSGHKFRRQVPRGIYVLDFACLTRRLVIELDGAHHADSLNDPVRDAWLEERGFRVLRFGNREVLENIEGVVRTILDALGEPPHPP